MIPITLSNFLPLPKPFPISTSRIKTKRGASATPFAILLSLLKLTFNLNLLESFNKIANLDIVEVLDV